MLQEARLSSEIENIVTTDDELFRAAAMAAAARGPMHTRRKSCVTARPCRRPRPVGEDGCHQDRFEAIRPFPAGNGRTGRILNLLYLVDPEKLDRESWLLYALNAVESTAQQTFDQVTWIRAVMERKRFVA